MEFLKKLFSTIILTLFLLNHLAPILTFAAENTLTGNSEGTEKEEVSREYEVKDKETWDVSKNGDGSVIAKWNLEDRTLTISGSGGIKSWTSYKEEDWHSSRYTKIIKNVIIENGLTEIPSYAFYGCSSLTNIEIPESVKKIGERTFGLCKSLKKMKIPRSVTEIGGGIFAGCSSLNDLQIDANNENYTSENGILFNKDKTQIVSFIEKEDETSYIIPNTVTDIAIYAFAECRNLKDIEIPISVTQIGSYAFYRCSSLKTINIPNSVTRIVSEVFYDCISLTNVEIPNSVTYIGGYAFYNCNSLENIELPNSVTKIGDFAFSGCSNLTNIAMPSSLENLGDYAFSHCSKLANIEIPNSVTIIGKGDFLGCNNLKDIKIPSSVTSIGTKAFYECGGPIICNTNTEAHRYAETEKIGYKLLDEEESNYEKNYQLEDEQIWDISENGDGSVIAKWTLNDRTLTISGNGKMKDWKYSEKEDWHKTLYVGYIDNVIINQGITHIGNYSFDMLYNLVNIEIPNSVTEIYDYAFYRCSSLTEIEIPSSVTYISSYAFKICSSLKNINVDENNQNFSSENGVLYNKKKTSLKKYPEGKQESSFAIPNGVTFISEDAFEECANLKNIEIPNSLTSIGRSAFSECSNLTHIEIPSSVINIDRYAFYGCGSLKSIEVDNNNQNYTSENGILYNKDKTELIKYPAGKIESTYSMPNSVTSLKEHAISECSNLVEIKMSSGVTNIEDYTFSEFHGVVLCEKNSKVHKYAESLKLGYILYNDRILGVEENKKYFRRVTPRIKQEELKSIELIKDGAKVVNYINGQELTEAGEYRIMAIDNDENSTAINFSIYDIETKNYKEQNIENINYIGKINIGTKTQEIEKILKNVKNFKIKRNGIEIYSNTNKTNNQNIATGDKIEFEEQEYTMIVIGDINEDGKLNIIDLARCMKAVLRNKELSREGGLAADTNFDGKINIIDLVKIRNLSLNN